MLHLILNIFEYTSWIDPRLEFGNKSKFPKFPEFLKEKKKFDISKERYSIWMPNIAYTEVSGQVNSTETMYVYSTGRVIFYRKLAATFTCPFSFENIPNDT